MITNRARAIHTELVNSFFISGKVAFTPTAELLEKQAVMMDAELDSKIGIELIIPLFKIARTKEDLPALSAICKAYKSDTFHTKRAFDQLERSYGIRININHRGENGLSK